MLWQRLSAHTDMANRDWGVCWTFTWSARRVRSTKKCTHGGGTLPQANDDWASDMFHVSRKDLVDEIEAVITVGDFYHQSEGKGIRMLFV